MSPRALLLAGALGALSAVAAGAFGAHGLEGRIDPRSLSAFITGAQYQMYHSLALVALAALQGGALADRRFALAGVCFLAGLVLFSGSLYVLALTGLRGVGIVTPFGGSLFLAGWVLVVAGAWRSGR